MSRNIDIDDLNELKKEYKINSFLRMRNKEKVEITMRVGKETVQN